MATLGPPTLPPGGLNGADLRAGATAPGAKPGHATPAEARRLGEEFETLLLAQMLGPVFDQIKADSLFGGGHGEDMYRSLLVDQYAKRMVQAGGIGVAASVQETILKMQEKIGG